MKFKKIQLNGFKSFADKTTFLIEDGLTGIVGTFFVKDYLNLSAAFLAGLGFWAGIPWALKMPLGHLVDLIWDRKNYMVFFGAFLKQF